VLRHEERQLKVPNAKSDVEIILQDYNSIFSGKKGEFLFKHLFSVWRVGCEPLAAAPVILPSFSYLKVPQSGIVPTTPAYMWVCVGTGTTLPGLEYLAGH
jgi:hypothetical protein